MQLWEGRGVKETCNPNGGRSLHLGLERQDFGVLEERNQARGLLSMLAEG